MSKLDLNEEWGIDHAISVTSEMQISPHAVCENVKADLISLLTKYSSYAVPLEGLTEHLVLESHLLTACELLLMENIIDGFRLTVERVKGV